jgi:hypothetical protein
MPDSYNKTAFTADERHFDHFPEAPHVGAIAPDAPLEDLDSGDAVTLAALWRRDTVVMEFGSYS